MELVTVGRPSSGEPRWLLTLVHGDARGADRMAEAWAKERGWELDPFPADWDRYGAAAGPRRNREMVASGADAAFAFWHHHSRGTRDCIDLIRKAEIPLEIFRDPFIKNGKLYWRKGK